MPAENSCRALGERVLAECLGKVRLRLFLHRAERLVSRLLVGDDRGLELAGEVGPDGVPDVLAVQRRGLERHLLNARSRQELVLERDDLRDLGLGDLEALGHDLFGRRQRPARQQGPRVGRAPRPRSSGCRRRRRRSSSRRRRCRTSRPRSPGRSG